MAVVTASKLSVADDDAEDSGDALGDRRDLAQLLAVAHQEEAVAVDLHAPRAEQLDDGVLDECELYS